MITELLKRADSDPITILAIIAIFLVVVGGALYLTPRIARWLDNREKTHPGYFDGMMEQPPEAKETQKTEETEEKHV